MALSSLTPEVAPSISRPTPSAGHTHWSSRKLHPQTVGHPLPRMSACLTPPRHLRRLGLRLPPRARVPREQAREQPVRDPRLARPHHAPVRRDDEAAVPGRARAAVRRVRLAARPRRRRGDPLGPAQAHRRGAPRSRPAAARSAPSGSSAASPRARGCSRSSPSASPPSASPSPARTRRRARPSRTARSASTATTTSPRGWPSSCTASRWVRGGKRGQCGS
jgi:hypothetical protein